MGIMKILEAIKLARKKNPKIKPTFIRKPMPRSSQTKKQELKVVDGNIVLIEEEEEESEEEIFNNHFLFKQPNKERLTKFEEIILNSLILSKKASLNAATVLFPKEKRKMIKRKLKI